MSLLPVFALLIVPFVGAAITFAVPSNQRRPLVLLGVAVVHFVLSWLVLTGVVPAPDGDWLWLDPPGRLVLGLLTVLFLACSVYAQGYLSFRHERPNLILVAALCTVLGGLTVSVFSRHVGLMWISLEGSALSAAPLIYFNHNRNSIEATWKYLLVGSVGVALGLLGTFMLAYAAIHSGGEVSLRIDDLGRLGPLLSPGWVKASFALATIGYGTKMGLAPMHTWKPDAYGEAPGIAGAMFAGGMTSVAFLAILRMMHVAVAAGQGGFARGVLLFLGLLSIGIAAGSMVGQHDLKRLLAYSSVEHMGVLAVGVGLGGMAAFGAMLHLVYNGLTKGVLFLSVGNLHRAYGSKTTPDVRGALRAVPFSGTMFLFGFLAITGAPPFGPFLSEMTIARAAFAEGDSAVGVAFLALLMVVFVGMGVTVLDASLGTPPELEWGWRDRGVTSIPILLLLGLVLVLGVFIPQGFGDLAWAAVHWVEGTP